MKAITHTRYGSTGVLDFKDIPTPTPCENEILVRIHATTVTPVDASFRSARPFYTRFYTGMLRPKNPVLGTELAGVVEAVGIKVTRFKPADRIFASPADGFGAHAQFICLPEDGAQAIMPAGMSFEQAAAICNGALTALPFLRDSGKIKPGQKVLINGASGSIGTFAIQLARHYGAEVTAVCSGDNAELVRSLGAHHVIDYTREDFTRMGETWDIIFDTVNKTRSRAASPR
jgi:NADPH:quinone reductase-like Zn-dependent oxidoreductase